MPFLCTSRPASVVASVLTRSGARWFEDQKGQHRGTMLTENTKQQRRDIQRNTTHKEGSENSLFTHDRSNNKIHLLPKTESGGCSTNHDKSEGWDSWSESSLTAQTTMRNPQAHQRLHAFQLVTLAIMCHRPHMAQPFQRRVIRTPFQRNLKCFGWTSIENCPHFPRLNWRSACMVEKPLALLLAVRHSAQAFRGSTASVGLNWELFQDVLKLPEDVPPLSAFDNRVKSSTWSVPLFSIWASLSKLRSCPVERFCGRASASLWDSKHASFRGLVSGCCSESNSVRGPSK